MKLVVYCIFLLCGTPTYSQDASKRGLLVYSQVIGESAFSFIVRLMRCPTSIITEASCTKICGGALISPNMIVTSAFCVMAEVSAGATSPVDLYALIATKQLVKISGVRTNGFGKNARFGFDNDLALLTIDECQPVGSGGISPIKVASASSDVVDCDTVYTLGSGQSSMLPLSLRTGDTSLRITASIVHSPSVCKSEFVSLALGDVSVANIAPVDAARLNATMISDLFLCSGGETPASICFGDAGAPVVNSATDALVGIASVLPSGTCGLGPDYATKLAFHAKWISGQLTSIPSCPGWSMEKSFTSWPIPNWIPSSDLKSTRCAANQWQCITDGVCLHDWQVCDGISDCNDGSDEAQCESSRRLAQCANVESVCSTQLGAAQKAVNAVKTASDENIGLLVKALAQTCTALTTCAGADLSTCSLSSAAAPIAVQCRDAATFVVADQRNGDYSNSFNSRNKITCGQSHSNIVGSDGSSGADSVSLQLIQLILAIMIAA